MWNTCKFDLCESWTARPDGDYCESHRRAIAKGEEEAHRHAEKRSAQIERQKQKRQEPRKMPNKVSEKRKEENAEYKILRDKFLMENPMCYIHANEYCTTFATTIHHSAGRIGALFLDVKKWKGACMSCHQYAHDHPLEAFQKGWSESRLATIKQTI